MSPRLLLLAAALLPSGWLHTAEVKRIPPPGIVVPDTDRAELQTGIDALAKEIAALRQDHAAEIADVEVFHKSADWALRYHEFFNEKQIPIAKAHLAIGMQRAKELREGQPSWNSASGLVVRGYTSAVDGSVQPYGLVISDDWKADDGKPRRLDFWLHGRGEQLSELAFIEDRLRNRGEFPPEGIVAAAPPSQGVPAAPSPPSDRAAGAPREQPATGASQLQPIVCHLYGRFCNANKFAGERDLFEALADIQKHYQIDLQRLVVRGFSMGGASTWQFATHSPGMWAAAAPGAGFAETAEFFHVFAEGKTPPPWWEQVLWRWYDCTTMAANLANTSVVAYSGEIDGQKQAADIMVKYAKEEGIEFPHIIGAKMGHKYDVESKGKIEEWVTATTNAVPTQPPRKVRFATYSLIYPKCEWVTIVSMEREWERATVDAEWTGDGSVTISTKNVRILSLSPVVTGRPDFKNEVTIDGDLGRVPASNEFTYVKERGKWWVKGKLPPEISHRKKQTDLCGPIDHAFMSSFLFVRPTGQPMNDAVGAWAKAELEHATEFWRRVFRGDAPVKDDTAVTAEDMANKHLILWGDPSSNAVLARITSRTPRSQAELGNARAGEAQLRGNARAQVQLGHEGTGAGQLPLKWDSTSLEFSGVKYDAAHHAPILIFPNPLNPQKYIVLNSGPTFREEALLNNSDQTPKLPDWAIVNLDTPSDGKWPGLVIDAGFFDEQWALPKK